MLLVAVVVLMLLDKLEEQIILVGVATIIRLSIQIEMEIQTQVLVVVE